MENVLTREMSSTLGPPREPKRGAESVGQYLLRGSGPHSVHFIRERDVNNSTTVRAWVAWRA